MVAERGRMSRGDSASRTHGCISEQMRGSIPQGLLCSNTVSLHCYFYCYHQTLTSSARVGIGDFLFSLHKNQRSTTRPLVFLLVFVQWDCPIICPFFYASDDSIIAIGLIDLNMDTVTHLFAQQNPTHRGFLTDKPL